MDNWRILHNINNNFSKLFLECTNGIIFIPPTFTMSKEIDALIILNQIADIMSNKENIILNQTLSRIIFIKCKEFTEIYFNVNSDNFRESFINYINYTFNLTKDNMIID